MKVRIPFWFLLFSSVWLASIVYVAIKWGLILIAILGLLASLVLWQSRPAWWYILLVALTVISASASIKIIFEERRPPKP